MVQVILGTWMIAADVFHVSVKGTGSPAIFYSPLNKVGRLKGMYVKTDSISLTFQSDIVCSFHCLPIFTCIVYQLQYRVKFQLFFDWTISDLESTVEELCKLTLDRSTEGIKVAALF